MTPVVRRRREITWARRSFLPMSAAEKMAVVRSLVCTSTEKSAAFRFRSATYSSVCWKL